MEALKRVESSLSVPEIWWKLGVRHRHRLPNVMDDFERVALWFAAAISLSCERVIGSFKQISSWRGWPQ